MKRLFSIKVFTLLLFLRQHAYLPQLVTARTRLLT